MPCSHVKETGRAKHVLEQAALQPVNLIPFPTLIFCHFRLGDLCEPTVQLFLCVFMYLYLCMDLCVDVCGSLCLHM